MSTKIVLIFAFQIIFLFSCGEGPTEIIKSSIKAELKFIAGLGNHCNLARFSKDGNFVVGSVSQYWLTYSSIDPEMVYLLDIKNNSEKKFALYSHVDEMDCSAISPDGKYVAGGGTVFNGWFGIGVAIWDVATASYYLHNNDFEGWPQYLEFSTTGDSLFVYTNAGILYVWDLITQQIERMNKDEKWYCKYFKISPDGKYLFFNCSVKLLDISQNPHIIVRDNVAYHGDILPNYKQIVTANEKNFVKLYDISSGKILKTYTFTSNTTISKVAVSPSGKYFAASFLITEEGSSNEQQGVSIFETETFQPIGGVDYYGVKFLEFGNDDSKLLITSDDGTGVYEITYIPVN